MTSPAEPMAPADADVWAAVETYARRASLPDAVRHVLGDLAYRFRIGASIPGIGALAVELNLSHDRVTAALCHPLVERLVAIRAGGPRPARFSPRTRDAAAFLAENGQAPMHTEKPEASGKTGSIGKSPKHRASPRTRSNSLSSSSSPFSPPPLSPSPPAPVVDSAPPWTPLDGLELRRQLAAAVLVLQGGEKIKRILVSAEARVYLEGVLAAGLPLSSVVRGKSKAIDAGSTAFNYLRTCLQEDLDLRRSWDLIDGKWEDVFWDLIGGKWEVRDPEPAPRAGDLHEPPEPISIEPYLAAAER
ncbi:MAG: hypothetical protein AB7T37_13925 [Dehalococcoidia bacterium]